MTDQQDFESLKLGTFPWELKPEQLLPPAEQPLPWYQRLPSFTWERTVEQKHAEIFNDKALKRKFKTESGSIEVLDYREPCLGASTGTPAAAPPTGIGWHWLTGDEIRDADGLTSTKGFVPSLKHMLSDKLASVKRVLSGSSEFESIPEKTAKRRSISLPSFATSSRSRVDDAYTRRTLRSRSEETVLNRRADWSQDEEEPRRDSYLKRLFS